MSKIVYNKLIRDKIPEVIERDGKKYTTHVADNAEYLAALKQKLVEEAHEAVEAANQQELINELADIHEVIESIMTAENISLSRLNALRAEKSRERGGFKKRL